MVRAEEKHRWGAYHAYMHALKECRKLKRMPSKKVLKGMAVAEFKEVYPGWRKVEGLDPKNISRFVEHWYSIIDKQGSAKEQPGRGRKPYLSTELINRAAEILTNGYVNEVTGQQEPFSHLEHAINYSDELGGIYDTGGYKSFKAFMAIIRRRHRTRQDRHSR